MGTGLDAFVSELQSLADLGHDPQSFFRFESSILHERPQVHAVDVFHDEVEELVGLAEIVDLNDVRMVEPRQAWASRAKRSAKADSSPTLGGRIFTATSRFSLRCRALYTTPIPPRPRSSRISNWGNCRASASTCGVAKRPAELSAGGIVVAAAGSGAQPDGSFRPRLSGFRDRR